MMYQEPENYELLQPLLSDLNAGKISIPQLQRPFYYTEEEVLSYIKKLYRNRGPERFILEKEEGQPDTLTQRDTKAIMLLAVFFGKEVLTPNREKKKIILSFNIKTEELRIQTPETASSPEWIADISIAFDGRICDTCFALDTYGDTLSSEERNNIDHLFGLKAVRVHVRRVGKD